MAKAFKCEACGEFQEGKPNRVKLLRYGGVGIGGDWIRGDRIERAELCGTCYYDLKDAVAEVLE